MWKKITCSINHMCALYHLRVIYASKNMFYTHTTISSKSWNNFLRSKNIRRGSYWPKTSFSTFVDRGFFEKYFKYFFIFFAILVVNFLWHCIWEPFSFFVCLRKVWFISLLFCHFSRKLFFECHENQVYCYTLVKSQYPSHLKSY